jgi:hypothetical protein
MIKIRILPSYTVLYYYEWYRTVCVGSTLLVPWNSAEIEAPGSSFPRPVARDHAIKTEEYYLLHLHSQAHALKLVSSIDTGCTGVSFTGIAGCVIRLHKLQCL